MKKLQKLSKASERNMVAWGAIASCKVVYMGDRRQKRSKDARKSWKREEW